MICKSSRETQLILDHPHSRKFDLTQLINCYWNYETFISTYFIGALLIFTLVKLRIETIKNSENLILKNKFYHLILRLYQYCKKACNYSPVFEIFKISNIKLEIFVIACINNRPNFILTEAVAVFQCSVKKVFLKFLKNSQENICSRLFNKVAGMHKMVKHTQT